MDELMNIKTSVSLQAFAEHHGYVRDAAKSSRLVAVLRNGDDKIIVTQGRGGYDIFRCERNHADSGSIVDFAMSRLNVNMGRARQEIRAFAGLVREKGSLPSHPVPQARSAATEPDRKKVAAVWSAAQWCPAHPFLRLRGLPLSVLNDARFLDTFRMDKRGNVVFPHFDRQGMCGYELKGPGGFKSFGAGTVKGLWFSVNWRSASRVLICESSVDCLSHCALQGGDSSYVSFGGGMGSRQRDLLRGLFEKAADRGAVVLIGTDNDPAGDQYAATLASLSPVALERILPVGKDWNDDLLAVAKEVA